MLRTTKKSKYIFKRLVARMVVKVEKIEFDPVSVGEILKILTNAKKSKISLNKKITRYGKLLLLHRGKRIVNKLSRKTLIFGQQLWAKQREENKN